MESNHRETSNSLTLNVTEDSRFAKIFKLKLNSKRLEISILIGKERDTATLAPIDKVIDNK